MSTPQATQQPSSSGAHVIVLRVALLFSLLYLFLVAIKLLESGIKLAGAGAAEGIFNGVSNPFAGLAAGILATVLVQSSSVTTSTIVALVGSGTVSLEAAVPMILGANVGTTITNTLVSLGSVARRTEFRRAFAAATAHDFFKRPMVLVINEDEKWVAHAANCLFPIRNDGIRYVSGVITSDKRKMLCAAVDFEST